MSFSFTIYVLSSELGQKKFKEFSHSHALCSFRWGHIGNPDRNGMKLSCAELNWATLSNFYKLPTLSLHYSLQNEEKGSKYMRKSGWAGLLVESDRFTSIHSYSARVAGLIPTWLKFDPCLDLLWLLCVVWIPGTVRVGAAEIHIRFCLGLIFLRLTWILRSSTN